MSDPTSKPPARSRLRGGSAQQPVMGVGAGLPENQRQAGVRDPQAASRAAVDPVKARRQAEEDAQAEAELLARRGEVLEAHRSGLIFGGEDRNKVINKIQDANASLISQWELEIKEATEARIDEEEEAGLSGAFVMQPSDPQYAYMYDKKLREATEMDLEELDFTAMVFDGFAEQTVPVGKLQVTFRTISGTHSLWLERRMHEARNLSEIYGRHWFSMLQLACSVQSINGKAIGTDLNEFENEDHNKAFWTALEPRLKILGRLPSEISDLMITNLAWFSGRIRKDLTFDLMERVGNS